MSLQKKGRDRVKESRSRKRSEKSKDKADLAATHARRLNLSASLLTHFPPWSPSLPRDLRVSFSRASLLVHRGLC